MGYKIATFYASSNVPPPLDGVSFAIVDSNGQPRQSAGNFRVEGRDNYMNLRLNGPLNYKINNTYTLRLRVTVSFKKDFHKIEDIIEMRLLEKLIKSQLFMPKIENKSWKKYKV